MSVYQHFIDGRFVASKGGAFIPVVDPANSSTVAQISAGTAQDINAAVSAARACFNAGTWSRLPAKQRAEKLRAVAKAVMANKAMLASLETKDSGKPLPETEWDIDDVAGCFDYYADLAEKSESSVAVELPEPGFAGKMVYEPLGVAALITPWNYPLLMATWKIAPALAAGCTCVLKPSEEASMTCVVFAELAHSAGLPAGALNVVTGEGEVAGAALAAHPDVDIVAFTGSGATGSKVATAAAANLVPCGLELGGKSAIIVMDDVDVVKAVEWIMFGCFWTNG